jgi:hypothetical protein
MTRLWGDETWKDAGYDQVQTLFDYRYFASQKEAGMDIVTDIFTKYRKRQRL